METAATLSWTENCWQQMVSSWKLFVSQFVHFRTGSLSVSDSFVKEGVSLSLYPVDLLLFKVWLKLRTWKYQLQWSWMRKAYHLGQGLGHAEFPESPTDFITNYDCFPLIFENISWISWNHLWLTKNRHLSWWMWSQYVCTKHTVWQFISLSGFYLKLIL